MRNQGSLGICDSEAASTLYDSALTRLGLLRSTDSATSALFLSAFIAHKRGQPDLTSPATEQLLWEPNRSTVPFCSEQEIAKALVAHARPEREMCFEALRTYRMLTRPGRPEEFVIEGGRVRKWPKNTPLVDNCHEWRALDTSTNGKVPVSLELMSLMLKTPLSTPGQLVALVQPYCKSNLTLPKLNIKPVRAYEEPSASQRAPKLRQAIDEMLEQSLPVAAKICSGVLEDRKVVGVDDGYLAEAKCNSAQGENRKHTVVISGRRQTLSGRQYLVRNSWGTSCDEYDRSFECSSGNVWVDETPFLNNTSVVVQVR